MKCSNCQYDNGPQATKCARCGAPLYPADGDGGFGITLAEDEVTDDSDVRIYHKKRSTPKPEPEPEPEQQRPVTARHRPSTSTQHSSIGGHRRRRHSNAPLIFAIVLLIMIGLVVLGICFLTFTSTGQQWKASMGFNAPASAFWTLGDEAAVSGDVQLTTKYYEQAFSRDPDSYEGAIKLAQALERSGDTERAERAYRKAISLAPNLRLPYDNLLRMFEERAADESEIAELLSLAYQNTGEDSYRDRLIEYGPSPVRFDPAEGAYDHAITLQMASDQDSSIYYTTDGSTPTLFSSQYVLPIELGEGTFTVKAIAYQNGLYSGETSVSYTISYPAVDTPQFASQPGKYAADDDGAKTISVYVPEGCRVYYTVDGGTPDSSSSLYTDGITLTSGRHTVAIIAINSNGMKSNAASAEFNIIEPLKDAFNDEDQFLSFKVDRTTLDDVNGHFKNILDTTGDTSSVFKQVYRFGEVEFTVKNGVAVVTSVVVTNDDITGVRGTMVGFDANEVINKFRNEQQKIIDNEKVLYSDASTGSYGWVTYNDDHDITSVNYQYERSGSQLIELHYTIENDRVVRMEYCISDK